MGLSLMVPSKFLRKLSSASDRPNLNHQSSSISSIQGFAATTTSGNVSSTNNDLSDTNHEHLNPASGSLVSSNLGQAFNNAAVSVEGEFSGPGMGGSGSGTASGPSSGTGGGGGYSPQFSQFTASMAQQQQQQQDSAAISNNISWNSTDNAQNPGGQSAKSAISNVSLATSGFPVNTASFHKGDSLRYDWIKFITCCRLCCQQLCL